VDEQDVLIGRGLRSNEILYLGCARFKQALVDALVLLGGKNVGADGEVVLVAVDEFEGEHSKISTWHLAQSTAQNAP